MVSKLSTKMKTMNAADDASKTDRVLLALTNLRDQGGYRTADGRLLRTGLLYRGGHMAELDGEQQATYERLGLATIIDLRRQDEIDQRPTPTFGHETNLHCSVSDGDSAFAQMAGFLDDPDAAEKIVAAGSGYYERIITHNLKRFTPVFETLLNPDHLPALFHCTAGKDRTGFTGAAILTWLGVPDDVVMADFLLSNEVRRPYMERRAQELRHQLAGKRGVDPSDITEAEVDAFRTLLSVNGSYLQAVRDAVARDYGDWHEMRRTGLGIDDSTLDRFSRAVLV